MGSKNNNKELKLEEHLEINITGNTEELSTTMEQMKNYIEINGITHPVQYTTPQLNNSPIGGQEVQSLGQWLLGLCYSVKLDMEEEGYEWLFKDVDIHFITNVPKEKHHMITVNMITGEGDLTIINLPTIELWGHYEHPGSGNGIIDIIKKNLRRYSVNYQLVYNIEKVTF